jgi:hypothetical protein
MRKPILLPACSAGLLSLAVAHQAAAHAVAGNRFFPATLTVDDPGVADELSLPTYSSFKTADDPSARELDAAAEFSKRLTSRLGVSVGQVWTRVKAPGAAAIQGFQDLDTTVKYQFLTSAPHEAILAAAVSYEWGGSGSDRLGVDHHSTVTPTLYFGKGAGDLPDGLAWGRPFALTGAVGYAVPTRLHDGPNANPRVMTYGFVLEYSLPYLSAHVKDYGLPDFVNQLTPVVEGAFRTPVANTPDHHTTGTINPGLIWAGPHYQVAAEATLPINRESGRGTGFIVQVHFFLDDLFPRSIGKPIW